MQQMATLAAVKEAVARLTEEGRGVTVEAVRSLIGGSPATISKQMKILTATSSSTSEQVAPELEGQTYGRYEPQIERVMAVVRQAVGAISSMHDRDFAELNSSFSSALATMNSDAESACNELRQKLEEALNDAATIRANFEQAKDLLEDSKDECQTMKNDIEALRKAQAEIQSEIDIRNGEIKNLLIERDALRDSIDHLMARISREEAIAKDARANLFELQSRCDSLNAENNALKEANQRLMLSAREAEILAAEATKRIELAQSYADSVRQLAARTNDVVKLAPKRAVANSKTDPS